MNHITQKIDEGNNYFKDYLKYKGQLDDANRKSREFGSENIDHTFNALYSLTRALQKYSRAQKTAELIYNERLVYLIKANDRTRQLLILKADMQKAIADFTKIVSEQKMSLCISEKNKINPYIGLAKDYYDALTDGLKRREIDSRLRLFRSIEDNFLSDSKENDIGEMVCQ